MKKLKISALAALTSVLLLSGCSGSQSKEELTFKDAFEGKFLMGTALNVEQIAGNEPKAIEIAKKHFNSVVAENCMKMENIHPEEDIFFWDEADAFVEFAEKTICILLVIPLFGIRRLPPGFLLMKTGRMFHAKN